MTWNNIYCVTGPTIMGRCMVLTDSLYALSWALMVMIFGSNVILE